MQDWVTIMTFTYPHESYLIKGALESAGINTFLQNELTIQVHNFLSNAMGGIQLQVPKEQVDKAREILISNGYLDNLHKNNRLDEINIFSKDNYNILICPFCNSENIGKKRRSTILIIISILLLGIPLPIFKRNFYCYKCENEWKYK